MLQMITMVCTVICLASLVLSQLNNKKEKFQKNNIGVRTEYYDLKIDILEKTSQTLLKNYESVSNKNEKVIKENQNLINRCSEVLQETKILNGNNNKLLEKVKLMDIKIKEQDIKIKEQGNKIKEQGNKIKEQVTEIKELRIENERLNIDIKNLKEENRKIISALEQYDIMAPHFKIKEPFSIKIVK